MTIWPLSICRLIFCVLPYFQPLFAGGGRKKTGEDDSSAHLQSEWCGGCLGLYSSFPLDTFIQRVIPLIAGGSHKRRERSLLLLKGLEDEKKTMPVYIATTACCCHFNRPGGRMVSLPAQKWVNWWFIHDPHKAGQIDATALYIDCAPPLTLYNMFIWVMRLVASASCARSTFLIFYSPFLLGFFFMIIFVVFDVSLILLLPHTGPSQTRHYGISCLSAYSGFNANINRSNFWTRFLSFFTSRYDIYLSHHRRI